MLSLLLVPLACSTYSGEHTDSTQQALDFVCPAGCVCTCDPGEPPPPNPPPSAGNCDLSGYSPGVWRATKGQPSVTGTYIAQGIAIDPNTPGTVWIAMSSMSSPTTTTSGLFKSTDCGATWTKMGTLSQPLQVRINPRNSAEMYAGCGVGGLNNGFFYSSDAGKTWTERSGWSEAVARFDDVYHIAVDPSNFAHALVSFHYSGTNQYNASGIAETFDKGATWREHAPISGWSGTTGSVVDFLYDPATSQGNSATWLYSTQSKGFWRTTNSGASWTQVSTKDQSHGGNALLYAGGWLYSGGTYYPMRSSNNGATWQDLTDTSYGYYMAIGTDGSKLYTVKWGGGYLNSSTDGLDWTAHSAQGEIPGGAYEFTRFDPTNRILYAGMWQGGVWAMKVP